MPYYFSYDALIPDYIEEEGFYTKDELHCTLAYSKEDFSDKHLDKLNSFNIPKEEEAIITKIEILNNHITLLIDNPNLIITNKNILKHFSIVEDYKERIMHVSIKKKLKEIPASLKDWENKYCGQKIILNNPKLFIKHPISKEKKIINLDTMPLNNKMKLKY
jgi:hypothetical protein